MFYHNHLRIPPLPYIEPAEYTYLTYLFCMYKSLQHFLPLFFLLLLPPLAQAAALPPDIGQPLNGPLFIAPGPVVILEGGTNQLQIRLTSPPSEPVRVLLPRNTELYTLGPGIANPVISFTQTNWNQFQTIRLVSSGDALVQGNTVSTLSFQFLNPSLANISKELKVIIIDDDVPLPPPLPVASSISSLPQPPLQWLGLTQSMPPLAAGSNGAVDVSLKTRPAFPVFLALTSENGITARRNPCIASCGLLIFTPKNWDTPQRVLINVKPTQTFLQPFSMNWFISSFDSFFKGEEVIVVPVIN